MRATKRRSDEATKGCVLLLAFLLAACNSTTLEPTDPGPEPPAPPAPRNTFVEPDHLEFIQTQPLNFAAIIRPDSRLLFIGDEITQQMFYPRAVATALLPLFPQGNVRYFNGGRNRATAADVAAWAPDLLSLSQPDVIFICLGFHAVAGPSGDATIADQRAHLAALVASLRAQAPQARLILLSAPAIEPGPDATASATAVNARLRQLAEATRDVAVEQNTGFIDLFVPTLRVYQAAVEAGAGPLTFNGRMPTELGHTVIASVILYGLGVTGEQLTPVAWSPLLPRDMAIIRPALGLTLPIPDPDAARRSRELYLSMIGFDEAFFRAWRLTSAQTPALRQRRLETAEQAWAEVRAALP